MSLNAGEGEAVRPSPLPCSPRGTPLPGHTGTDPAPEAALHPSAALGTLPPWPLQGWERVGGDDCPPSCLQFWGKHAELPRGTHKMQRL